MLGSADVEDGGDEALLDDDRAGAVAHELADADRVERVARLGPEEESHVPLRPDDRRLVAAGVEIRDRRGLGDVAHRGPRLRRIEPDVGVVVALVRDGEEEIQRLDRGRERAFERARFHRVFAAIADEERRPVGEEAVALQQLQLPSHEGALVEGDARDAPVVGHHGVHSRVQQRLVVLVRLLQVLRGHEEPLGPNGLARVDHVAWTVLPEVPASLSIPSWAECRR